MNLIGITGPIGHGKSTVANLIAAEESKSAHFESFYLIARVAERLHTSSDNIPSDDISEINIWLAAIPGILQDELSYTCDQEEVLLSAEHVKEKPAEYEKLFLHLENLRKNPKLLNQKITDKNKAKFRPILQWIGGYFAKRIDPGIWYNALVERARQESRKGTQLCVIGGVRFPTDAEIIKDAGGSVVKVFRPNMPQLELNDMTERERDSIQTDCTLINDGSLLDLKKAVKSLVKDVKRGKLKSKYQAKGIA